MDVSSARPTSTPIVALIDAPAPTVMSRSNRASEGICCAAAGDDAETPTATASTTARTCTDVRLPTQSDADAAAPVRRAREDVRVDRPFLVIDDVAPARAQHGTVDAGEFIARHLEVPHIRPYAELAQEPHEAKAGVPPHLGIVEVDVLVARRRIASHHEPPGPARGVRLELAARH